MPGHRSILSFSWTLFVALALTACSAAAASSESVTQSDPTSTAKAHPITLNVFAAASLTEAFTQIGKNFESQHPGVHVIFNFAGSQALEQQILAAAPADVFASAAQQQIDSLSQAGQLGSQPAKVFVKNQLVVIFPVTNPGKIRTLQDLAKPGLKLVLADKAVPVGQYSLDFMDKADLDPVFGPTFKQKVLKNVVSYEDNVKSVLAKVSLDEADAGIVYTTDVTPYAATKVTELDIPVALNIVATYPIATLKHSTHPDLAQAFVDAVLSPEGQAVLSRYGFIPPNQ